MSWIIAQGIGTALIEPGKPWQNNVSESFNGKFRDECLSLEFRLRAEANVIIETWRRHSKDGEQSKREAVSSYRGPKNQGRSSCFTSRASD
jgi:hypothetical protein